MLRFSTVYLAAAMALAPVASVLAESAAPRPDVHVGDIWSYHNMDGFDGTVTLEFAHKVVDISNDEITVKVSNKNVKNTQVQYFTREWNALDISSAQFTPFFPKYDFPLTVGKSWNKDFKTSKKDGSNFSGTVHAKVVAMEEVTVPAGTFSSFRISYDNESLASDNSANATKGNLTIWYAPAINNYVKSQTIVLENGRVRSKEITELTQYISGNTQGK